MLLPSPRPQDMIGTPWQEAARAGQVEALAAFMIASQRVIGIDGLGEARAPQPASAASPAGRPPLLTVPLLRHSLLAADARSDAR